MGAAYSYQADNFSSNLHRITKPYQSSLLNAALNAQAAVHGSVMPNETPEATADYVGDDAPLLLSIPRPCQPLRIGYLVRAVPQSVEEWIHKLKEKQSTFEKLKKKTSVKEKNVE